MVYNSIMTPDTAELTLYIRSLREQPATAQPITEAEALVLVERAHSGDSEASLILTQRSYLPVALSVRKWYSHTGHAVDLLSVALGVYLPELIRTYSPAKGAYLSYILFFIRKSLHVEYTRMVQGVAVSNGKYKESIRLRGVYDRARKEMDSAAALEQVVAFYITKVRKLDLDTLSPDRLAKYREQALSTLTLTDTNVSIDKTIDGDAGSRTYAETMPDGDSLEEKFDKAERKALVIKAIKTLPLNYQKVVVYFYGFGKEDPMSLAEIGRKLGVSRQRASDILKSAQKKLRLALTELY